MNCHICSHKTEVFVHEKTNMNYFHCKSCEYIFKSPECYQDFSAQKERYNLHENNEEDAGYIAYFKRFLDFILPCIDTVQTALDFGCGRTSLLANLLEKEGFDCAFYDPIYHPNTLDDEKMYDLIVSTEVFEHLHQPREVFYSLIKKLNHRGYLAIQTEFHSNEHTSFQKWWYPSDSTHIVFFRLKTFHVLAEKFGCKVLKSNDKNIVVLQKI